jgi:pyruvate,water dikinase
MGDEVRDLREVDGTEVALVGGKAAGLGELLRIDGVAVPAGFCVTTEAYREVTSAAPDLARALAALEHGDGGAETVRRSIEALPFPDGLAATISGAVEQLGSEVPLAVRSSATAEDLPSASFAGQQDSFLNVVGATAVLDHVRRCWASLFTDRAVAYRVERGIDHHRVQMAVVVQQMVDADVAGVLFTADPVSGNRRVSAVEATYGLGEAFVAGVVHADRFRVRGAEVLERAVASKQASVRPAPSGGTHEAPVPPERQDQPALTDDQVLELVRIGRRIEAHLGAPQDVEWCLTDDGFQVVQSRPITTLYPIPAAPDDGPHVYVSVGHQQMMTDAMRPLGLSVWQLTAIPPMHEAGSRLFVDIVVALSAPASRAALLELFGQADPLFRDAVEAVLEQTDLIPPLPEAGPEGAPAGPQQGVPPAPPPLDADPAIVSELVRRSEGELVALRAAIAQASGPEVFDFIRADVELRKQWHRDPHQRQVVMAGMEASWWIDEHVLEWLGEANAADVLTLSAPGNPTSEMGLALLDVADVIRPHPEVVAYVEQVGDDDAFLEQLPSLAGGAEARDALVAWLDRYGVRCVGEIDITRTRWAEQPSALLPIVLDHVRAFEPGEAARRFEHGRHEAEAAARSLLERLRALPDGEAKAAETSEQIDRLRTFIGYREQPKLDIVSRSFAYKQALLQEVQALVAAGVLAEVDDAWYLRFEELEQVVRTKLVDQELLAERRERHRAHERLRPPRVLTSEGEGFQGSYRRDDLPDDALVGHGISEGTVEGRARVVFAIADADLEPGDVLVTPFTDPSWSPVFVSAAGLVTEIGGLMSHGAVVAREYGLPAVVGVDRATERIRDGQQIRVHGRHGYVELLD